MSSPVWCLNPEASQCFKFWGDGEAAVFYSAASGDTHMLDALSVELHQLLLAAPMTEEQLLQVLAEVLEPGLDAEASDLLHDHLRRLQDIGLLLERAV